MIYFITYSKIVPGEPTGMMSGLLEDVYDNSKDAEQMYNLMKLNPPLIRKELWIKEPSGRKILLKEEHFTNGRNR